MVGAEFKKTAPRPQRQQVDDGKESEEYFKNYREERKKNAKPRERTVQKFKVSGRVGSTVKVQYGETIRINPAWHMLCRKMQLNFSLQEKKGLEVSWKAISKLAKSIEI